MTLIKQNRSVTSLQPSFPKRLPASSQPTTLLSSPRFLYQRSRSFLFSSEQHALRPALCIQDASIWHGTLACQRRKFPLSSTCQSLGLAYQRTLLRQSLTLDRVHCYHRYSDDSCIPRMVSMARCLLILSCKSLPESRASLSSDYGCRNCNNLHSLEVCLYIQSDRICANSAQVYLPSYHAGHSTAPKPDYSILPFWDGILLAMVRFLGIRCCIDNTMALLHLSIGHSLPRKNEAYQGDTGRTFSTKSCHCNALLQRGAWSSHHRCGLGGWLWLPAFLHSRVPILRWNRGEWIIPQYYSEIRRSTMSQYLSQKHRCYLPNSPHHHFSISTWR